VLSAVVVWLVTLSVAGILQGSPWFFVVALFGLLAAAPWLLPRRDDAERRDAEQATAIAPAGTEYVWRVAPAPRPTAWSAGPWALWAMVTNDKSWWLTAWTESRPGPVLRERYAQRDDALVAAAAFAESVRQGLFVEGAVPPLYRRRGRNPHL
jgi:hypothetical protein